MRKRGAHIQRRAKSVPGMIVQSMDAAYEIKLRSGADAFRMGFADGTHHANLCDACDMMLVAMRSYTKGKKDESALIVVELAGIALSNIRQRHIDTGKIGATGEEMHALQLLVETSLDFWNRRSGALYALARHELRKVRYRQYQELAR